MFAQNVFANDRLPVFVSIIPQKYFVQQIGKDLVDVKVMVQPGASPATYEPKPGQMVELSKTKIYFSIGVPFESAWLKKIAAANPKMKVVPTDQGIEKVPMAAHHHRDKKGVHHEAAEYAHAEGHHHHGGLDPHIWLSPPLVMIQSRMILATLEEVDPTHRTAYEANYKSFISEIVDIDIHFQNIFAGQRGLRFMVFHPAWGYFARAYGLIQVPIEMEGKEPKPAQLKELIEHARKNGIKVVFVQPQFSTKSAEVVAKEIGGQVAFADPLAENWAANLREVARKFKAALK
jgi:zinc transport system substrate-binding protein